MHVKIRPKHSPNKAQEFMVFVIFVSFPAAFASETDGRSITQAQLQKSKTIIMIQEAFQVVERVFRDPAAITKIKPAGDLPVGLIYE